MYGGGITVPSCHRSIVEHRRFGSQSIYLTMFVLG